MVCCVRLLCFLYLKKCVLYGVLDEGSKAAKSILQEISKERKEAH